MTHSKTSHWANVSEAGTLWGMRFMLAVYRTLGRRAFLLFLYPVISYYYLTKPNAREISNQYLDKVRPYAEASVGNPEALTSFRHFMMFGEVMLDKFLAWMGCFSKDDVVIETPEVFESFSQRKNGGVIIVSHLGNSEMCGALMDYLPHIDLTALVYTQHSENFSALLEQVNVAAKKVKLMQVTEVSPATAMLLAERTGAGEYIVIAGDRTPVTGDEHTSEVDFLGAPARMPQGAFILAGLLKVPVYLLFCVKVNGTYHIHAEVFSERLKITRKDRKLQLDSIVQRYAKRLEFYCVRSPLQWFNFYSFWSKENTSTLESASRD